MKIFSSLKLETTPTDPKDVVNKEYVDNAINQKFKAAVRVVAAYDLGCTYSMANKTLTQDAPAALVIDGVTLEQDDRILVAGQNDATQNGIYVLTTVGTDSVAAVLTRAEDFDETSEIPLGVRVPISEGTKNSGTTWVMTNETAVTLDSSQLQFIKDDGGAKVDKYEETITADGTATEFTITHGLGTKNIVVEVYDEADGEWCLFDKTIKTDNQIVLSSVTPPETGSKFIVTVIG